MNCFLMSHQCGTTPPHGKFRVYKLRLCVKLVKNTFKLIVLLGIKFSLTKLFWHAMYFSFTNSLFVNRQPLHALCNLWIFLLTLRILVYNLRIPLYHLMKYSYFYSLDSMYFLFLINGLRYLLWMYLFTFL